MSTFFLSPTNTWAQVEDAFAVQVATCKQYGVPLILRQNNLFKDLGQFTPWASESVDPDDPDAHGWHIYFNTSTGLWDTETQTLSPWSPKAIKYAYDFGKFFAACPTMQNLIRIFPQPELVICLDNNETNLSWGSAINNSDGLDRRMVESDDWEGLGFDNLIDFIADVSNTSRATKLGTETLRYFKELFYDVAETEIKSAFSRGFAEKLAETSRYWAENCFWMEYGGRNEDMDASNVSSGTVGGDFPTAYFALRLEKLKIGFSRGGRTSGCYRDTATTGGDNRKARVWYLASNERTSKNRARMFGEHRWNGKGVNFTLFFEGNGTSKPANANEWTGWMRHSMWVNHCGVSCDWNIVMHFLGNTKEITGDENVIYAQGLRDVVDEVHNTATLALYMTNGHIVPSLEGLPRMDQYWWPGHQTLPYYIQHVIENGRYDAAEQSAFEAITTAAAAQVYAQAVRRPEDNERNSTSASALLETVCTAYRITNYDKILILAIGAGSTQTNVTARIALWDTDEVIDFLIPSAPQEGTFWEFNLDGTGATAILT